MLTRIPIKRKSPQSWTAGRATGGWLWLAPILKKVMIVVCYTDASYNEYKDIAACGYCVLVGGKMVKHEVILLEGLGTVAAAEIFAVTTALQFAFLVKDVKQIFINTDYMALTTRRHKKKGYEDFDATMEIIKAHGIPVTINHVRAHRGNHHNNLVDKSCLKSLRNFIKQNHK